MSINPIHLKSCLDQSFCYSSVCEWLRSKTSNAEKFINALGVIFSESDDELVQLFYNSTDYCQATAEQMIDAFANKFDVEVDALLTMPNGYTTIRDFILEMVPQYNRFMNLDDEKVALSDLLITLKDRTGQIIEGATCSIVDVTDNIKESIFSAGAMASALYASKFSNISDKLLAYDTHIKNYINDAGGTAKSTVEYYKNMLTEVPNMNTMIDNLFKTTSVEEISTGQVEFVENTDIYQYTGATPLAAVFSNIKAGFSTFANFITMIANGFVNVINAVKPVFNTIFNGISGVIENVRETLVNPYDITSVKRTSADDYSFVGYQYQKQNGETTFSTDKMTNVSTTDFSNTFNDHYLNKWFFIKTIGGYNAFKITHPVSFSPVPNTMLWSTTLKYQYIFKPFTLRLPGLAVRESVSASLDKVTVNFSDGIQDINDFICVNGDDLYGTEGSMTENELFTSLINGIAANHAFIHEYVLACNNINTPNDTISYEFKVPASSAIISNLDWYNLATGYNGNTYNNNLFDVKLSSHGLASVLFSVEALALGFASIITSVCKDRYENDDNITYIPYTTTNTYYPTGRFIIKTDQQITGLASGIAATLLVAIPLAITALVIFHKIKKWARNAWWKRTEFVGRCDNKMWNASMDTKGRVLTSQERRKYLRYMRKNAAASAIVEGLVDETKTTLKDVINNPLTATLYNNIAPTILGNIDGLSDTTKATLAGLFESSVDHTTDTIEAIQSVSNKIGS